MQGAKTSNIMLTCGRRVIYTNQLVSKLSSNKSKQVIRMTQKTDPSMIETSIKKTSKNDAEKHRKKFPEVHQVVRFGLPF